jgi:hypothetical protein
MVHRLRLTVAAKPCGLSTRQKCCAKGAQLQSEPSLSSQSHCRHTALSPYKRSLGIVRYGHGRSPMGLFARAAMKQRRTQGYARQWSAQRSCSLLATLHQRLLRSRHRQQAAVRISPVKSQHKGVRTGPVWPLRIDALDCLSASVVSVPIWFCQLALSWRQPGSKML